MFRIALTSCWIFSIVNAAWKWDASCDQAARDLLEPHLECALVYAGNVQSILAMGGPERGKVDQVLEWMITNTPYSPHSPGSAFTPRDYTAMYFDGQFPPGWPGGIRFSGVNAVGTGGATTGNLGADDAMFYCNEDRFTWAEKLQRDGSTIGDWYDPATEEFQDIEDQNVSPKECTTTSLAYTQVPLDPNRWSVITVCPGFIDLLKKESRVGCTTWLSKVKAAVQVGAVKGFARFLATLKIYLTDIDVTSIPSKLLLHELFHTRPGGKTIDCGRKAGDEAPGGILKTAYGWKGCRELAPHKNIPNALRQSGTNNAETWTLIAVALNIIHYGNTVNEDGSLS